MVAGSATPLRLIRSGDLHPWLNMALDEVLSPDPPVLRLYGFNPPGISLGYFQKSADLPIDDLVSRGVIAVRRVTGGSAIYHKDDLTFSIVASPGDALFEGTVEESYGRIHAAIACGLRGLGVQTEARATGESLSDSGLAQDPVCFHKATTFDLVHRGRKLVGSAQRRRRSRILHHGSIPRARNELASHATSLEEAMGRVPSLEEVADALVRGFEEELGLSFNESSPTEKEWDGARKVTREQFGSDAWNRAR